MFSSSLQMSLRPNLGRERQIAYLGSNPPLGDCSQKCDFDVVANELPAMTSAATSTTNQVCDDACRLLGRAKRQVSPPVQTEGLGVISPA